MGFDKPNLAFVVHFQGTASVVHYYQQVGRAGRAIDSAVGFLLGGDEDEDIFESFVRNALPTEGLVSEILAKLHESDEGLIVSELAARINAPKGRIDNALTFLRLQSPSPIVKMERVWARTAQAFTYPHEHARELAERRRAQRAQMRDYYRARRCLMQELAAPLGDTAIAPCGRCFVCTQRHGADPPNLDELTARAEDFLNRRPIGIEPRGLWPAGDTFPIYGFRGRVAAALKAEPGRALSYYNVGTTGRRTAQEKYAYGTFSDRTVQDAADTIRAWYEGRPLPAWLVPMVSHRHPTLVPDFAKRLAAALGSRYVEALTKTRETAEQKTMANDQHQAKNLDGSLEVSPFEGMDEPGLFVDDMSDSRWTSTVAIAVLRRAGSGPVAPFTLLRQSVKSEDE